MASDSEDDRSQASSVEDSGAEQDGSDMAEHRVHKTSSTNSGSKTSNAKDPSRPRRKKARRACFACQRAHLTCGDERPCQRCIKRGLQDQCQDGVRKKAKYLHDAPSEALMPGAANNYSHGRNVAQSSDSEQQSNHFFQPSNGQPYNIYQESKHMPPPMLQDTSVNPVQFGQSPISPPFNMTSGAALATPNVGSSAQNTPVTTWNGSLFDANDASLFNFDLASMNFGNHYGALEFGMLGHMATGVGETPPSDNHTQRGSVGTAATSFNQVGGFTNSPESRTFGYGDSLVSEWPTDQSLYNQQFRNHQQPPHAFAIETHPANFHSPDSNASPQAMMNTKLEESPGTTTTQFRPPGGGQALSNNQSRSIQARQPHPPISTPNLKASALPLKKNRPRDPSHIYTSVTSPYSYTSGFHSLIFYLQKRFNASPQKTLQIAKSLASIRPSFIATTKTLNRDDLIFMEKCFQRTLWEYEGFIEGIGTPTITARTTGEIAAVGKEFCILTGWRKEVLLGKEPNLNVNRGSSATASGSNTMGSKTSGVNTPAQRNLGPTGSDGSDRPQPVFLAELLDDETVVDFYEDFARLAFGDSRGSVTGKGTLLKYKAKEELSSLPNGSQQSMDDSDRSGLKRHSTGNAKSANGIAGEGGMKKLGDQDGKVDCTYCWTVKRDVFDIPMLIVMNFLPVI